jgi:hypothetical protein
MKAQLRNTGFYGEMRSKNAVFKCAQNYHLAAKWYIKCKSRLWSSPGDAEPRPALNIFGRKALFALATRYSASLKLEA